MHFEAPPVEAFVHPFSPMRRYCTLALLALMMALVNGDQNLLAPNLSAAAKDFGLNAQQKDTYLGGLVMAAFFMVGAPAAMLCGWLTDKPSINRIYLLFTIVIIGHGPCLCTYFVTNFWQFFVLRMMTGIAVGGCIPLAFSFVGDLCPSSQRNAMAAAVQMAVGAGFSGGQLMSGLLGPATNWRVPYLVVGIPSLLMAFVILLTVRDPPRGAFEEALKDQIADGHAYNEAISWTKVKQALRCRSNVLLVLQAVPGCLPWGVIATFLNDFLSQDKGLSVAMATIVILVFHMGGAVGLVLGGSVGQFLYNRRKEWMVALCALATLLTPLPLFYVVNAPLTGSGLPAAFALVSLGGVLGAVSGPNLRAAVLNVNAPETRGVVLALQSITDDLGRGLGPIIVASVIASVGGRVTGFNIVLTGWVPTALLISCLVFCMRKDEAAVQARLAARVKGAAEWRGEEEGRPCGKQHCGCGGAPAACGCGGEAGEARVAQHRLRRRLGGGSWGCGRISCSAVCSCHMSSSGSGADGDKLAGVPLIHVNIINGSSSGSGGGGGGSDGGGGPPIVADPPGSPRQQSASSTCPLLLSGARAAPGVLSAPLLPPAPSKEAAAEQRIHQQQ